MKELIKQIKLKKIKCYFISPHLDDAILSAGGLISYLASKTTVEVITIFTKPSPKPYTLSTKVFLKNCNFRDAEDLFNKRRLEDQYVFTKLNLNYHHLGFTDASWRKKINPNRILKVFSKIIPELIHIYPIYRNYLKKGVTSGHVSNEDEQNVTLIKQKLNKIIKNKKNILIFCPIGIGLHVDHILVRNLCQNSFKNIIFWSDFPYSLTEKPDDNFIMLNNLKKLQSDKKINYKNTLISLYKTQVDAMFPEKNIPIINEVFYTNI